MQLCFTAVDAGLSAALSQGLGLTSAEPKPRSPHPGRLPCRGSEGVCLGSVEKQCPSTVPVSPHCPDSGQAWITPDLSGLFETTVNTQVHHLNLTSGAMLKLH